MRRRWWPYPLLLALSLFASTAAFAGPPETKREAIAEQSQMVKRSGSDRSVSRSIGRPNRGRLENSVALLQSKTLRYRSGGVDFRYGTEELVHALQGAADVVAQRLAGAQLSVGDLSRRRGGIFRPHRSHRSGRDVDVGFYLLNRDDQPGYHHRFVSIARDGQSRDTELNLRFDSARNWELVASLLSQPRARVQYIFVASYLRQRLLETAVERNASRELIERAALAMHQPSRGSAHRDHFHVRIYCAPDDRPACVDEAPYHSWYEEPEESPAHQIAQLWGVGIR